MRRKMTLIAVVVVVAVSPLMAGEIIHDAEYYVLEAQHGERWALQDEELQAKLDELRAKHGTPPNIIHVMWDDTPVGEVGLAHLQKNRGFETPVMNKFASEGIYFTRMYTEPSCTPSRAAVLTGRHAVRNGMYNVGFPYEYGGLAATEVTIAEVLGEAGYATGFYGKAHQGDVEQSYMTNQGFDEALWSPYNQVPSLFVPRGQRGALLPTIMYPEMFPEDPYDIDKGWRPKGYVWALEGVKGGPVREYGTPPNEADYYGLEREFHRRTIEFIRKNAAAEKPFFVAWWPQLGSFLNIDPKEDPMTLSYGVLQEGLARIDVMVGELLAEVKKAGIEENTLIILMADNGPMTHDGPPGMVEHIYRGGKGDYWEGALRVPAFARWPGVIDEGQIVGDIIHETDLFTTFANLAGAKEYIPTDRIIDGLDQTAVFLEGDTQSRRDYVFVYTGNELAATVKGRFKRRWEGEKPGLSGAAFYDLYNDPREVQPKMLPGFPAKGMFNIMKIRHLMMKEAFPDQGQVRDFPYKNIENARPATIEASKPRIAPDTKIPFDPREAIMKVPEWENLDPSWGLP